MILPRLYVTILWIDSKCRPHFLNKLFQYYITSLSDLSELGLYRSTLEVTYRHHHKRESERRYFPSSIIQHHVCDSVADVTAGCQANDLNKHQALSSKPS